MSIQNTVANRMQEHQMQWGQNEHEVKKKRNARTHNKQGNTLSG